MCLHADEQIRSNLQLTALVFALHLLWSASLPAQNPSLALNDWTSFRGPNGSGIGVATNIPDAWSEADYQWKTSLPGRGSSSPVIQGNHVYVTSGDEDTAKRFILCLNTTNGSVLWQREYGSRTFRKNRDNTYATSTPAVDASHVYVYWSTPDEITLIALNPEGQEAWHRNLGPYVSQHGSGASPMVFQDLVIVNNDQEGKSSLLALNASNGAIRWQVERHTSKAAYATPCVYQPNQGPAELIFASSAHGFTSLNPINGRLNWEFTNAFPARVVASPVVASGLVIGTCGEGGVGQRLVAVVPGSNQSEPRLSYELKKSIPYVPTPVVHNDKLYLWGDNGLVACHRADNGERLWQEKIPDSFYGSPVWINERLYCLSKTGVLYVLGLGTSPKLLATIPLGESSSATPAIANGILYLRTEAHLFAIGGQPKNAGASR
jgi:outer membrane protein assembly factor BamB